jgi:hypothetical protein
MPNRWVQRSLKALSHCWFLLCWGAQGYHQPWDSWPISIAGYLDFCHHSPVSLVMMTAATFLGKYSSYSAKWGRFEPPTTTCVEYAKRHRVCRLSCLTEWPLPEQHWQMLPTFVLLRKWDKQTGYI